MCITLKTAVVFKIGSSLLCAGNSDAFSPAWGEMCITGGVAQRNLRSAAPLQQSPAWGEIIGVADVGGGVPLYSGGGINKENAHEPHRSQVQKMAAF
jgi:hypothetical protein